MPSFYYSVKAPVINFVSVEEAVNLQPACFRFLDIDFFFISMYVPLSNLQTNLRSENRFISLFKRKYYLV